MSYGGYKGRGGHPEEYGEWAGGHGEMIMPGRGLVRDKGYGKGGYDRYGGPDPYGADPYGGDPYGKAFGKRGGDPYGADPYGPYKGGGKKGTKEGDWDCLACGDLQFARNDACRKCGADKDGRGGKDIGEKGGGKK